MTTIDNTEICKVRMQLEGSNWQNYQTSRYSLCKYNGVVRLGTLQSGFKHVDCKEVQIIKIQAETESEKQDEDSFNLSKCKHSAPCNKTEKKSDHIHESLTSLFPKIHPEVSQSINTPIRKCMDPEIRECVARAVFELVSDFGLSCDKERIKEDLFLDHLHLNTDSDINRRVVQLRVNNTTKSEYLDVEVKIVNVKAKVGEDFQFICPPCHLKDMKMILH